MTTGDVIDKIFGVKNSGRETPIAETIGTTALEVLPNNPSRLGWTIINLSTNVIYVGDSAAVSSTNGIRLSASGGYVGWKVGEEFHLVTDGVWCVASGAGSVIKCIAVSEFGQKASEV